MELQRPTTVPVKHGIIEANTFNCANELFIKPIALFSCKSTKKNPSFIILARILHDKNK